MKQLLSCVILTCFFLFLLLCPAAAAQYAKTGLLLWFNTLLPTMLPFMVLSDFLIKTGLLSRLLASTRRFWKAVFHLTPMGGYGLLTGVLCGYPMGAKTAAELYKSQSISRQEACYLLSFSSHPGPAFISSYLCAELLHQEALAPAACGVLYLSSFLSSLLLRRFYGFPIEETDLSKRKEMSPRFSWGEALDTSIMDSFSSITRLGGYVILFSLFQGILTQIPGLPPDLKCLLLGTAEITTGTAAMAQRHWPLLFSFPLLLAFAASGGLCVAFQTRSMLSETDLPLAPYLKGKLCAFLLTLILGSLVVEVLKIIV